MVAVASRMDESTAHARTEPGSATPLGRPREPSSKGGVPGNTGSVRRTIRSTQNPLAIGVGAGVRALYWVF